MDERRVVITANVTSVRISARTAEKLQNKQPVVRKGKSKGTSNKPKDSEVHIMVVHPEVWHEAQRIAAGNPKLIVVESDESVIVYNNVDQADKARKAKKEAEAAPKTSPE